MGISGVPRAWEGTCFSGRSLGDGDLSPLAPSPPGSVHTCREPRRSRDVCGLRPVRFQLGVRVQLGEEPPGARPDMRPQPWGAASAGRRVRAGQALGVCSGPAGPAGLRGRWSAGALACSLLASTQGLGVSLRSPSATHGRCRTDSVSQDGAGATWSPARAVHVPGGLRSKDEGGPSRAGGAGLGWSSGVGEVMGLHLCFLDHLAPPG